jgi:hypothetical protein
MSHYVKKCQFDNAYKVACLGVTEVDWRMLALAALKGHAWDVAKKGFTRLRDVCYLDLLHRFEQGHCSDIQKATLGALILAYQVSSQPLQFNFCIYYSYPSTQWDILSDLVPYDFQSVVLHTKSIISLHMWCMLGDSG